MPGLIRMMRTVLCILLLLSGNLLRGQLPEAPRLILFVVVDELSEDQLLLIQPKLSNKGIIRLSRDGMRFMGAYSSDLSAYPGTRITSLYTGCTPSCHGVVGERWLDRKTGRFVNANEGPANYQTAALNSMARGLGDYLKNFYGPGSLSAVVGVDQPWMLHATGYNCDYLLYWDNIFKHIRDYANSANESLWLDQLNDKRKGLQALSPATANQLAFDATVALLESTDFGRDNIPDLLSVGFNTGSLEDEYELLTPLKESTIMQIDALMAGLLDVLDKNIGKNNYLVIFTSARTPAAATGTHGRKGQNTGTVDLGKTLALLNFYYMARYGQGKWALEINDNNLYLDRQLIESKGMDVTTMQEEAAVFLMEVTGVDRALPLNDLLFKLEEGSLWDKNLFPSRTGDVLIRLQPGWHGKLSTNGSRTFGNSGNSPLPLIVSGWHSDKGAWIEPFEHRHLVPLLLKQLGIVHPKILEAPEAVIFKKK